MSARLSELPLLCFVDRESWRAWLEANHAASQGIWLAVGKKGNPVTSLTYEAAVEEALCFGWIDSTVRRLDEHRFRQLFTPRRVGGNWSLSNKARVARLIASARMTPAGLAPIEQAKADGSWTLLDEVEDLVVPSDLAGALAKAPEAARRHFAEFTDGQKKQILYWIVSAKRVETRSRRIAQTVTAAAEGRLPR